MSDAYLDVVIGASTVTLSISLDNPQNVLAFDIVPQHFAIGHPELGLSKESSYYLFDSTGALLSYETELDVDDPGVQEYLANIHDIVVGDSQDRGGARVHGLADEARYAFFARLDNGWCAVISVPMSELLAGSQDSGTNLLAFAFIALAVLSAVLLVRARIQSRGARAVERTLNTIGRSFFAIYRVDWRQGRYRTVKSAPDVDTALGDRGSYEHLLAVWSEHGRSFPTSAGRTRRLSRQSDSCGLPRAFDTRRPPLPSAGASSLRMPRKAATSSWRGRPCRRYRQTPPRSG